MANTEAAPGHSMPIVCVPLTLSESERARSLVLRRGLGVAMREVKALPNGYALRCSAEPALFHMAAEWIALERRCCPFLSFELTWACGESEAPWLIVTGPEGTKDFLAAEMRERSVP